MSDSVVVKVPAEVAWAFMSDPRQVLSSQPNTSVRLLNGSWDSVGSPYLATTRAWGRHLDTTHEITRFEPPRIVETRQSSMGVVATSMVQVERLRPDRCLIIVQGRTEEWGGSFFGAVARILTPLVGQRGLEATLQTFKRHIEERAGAPPFDLPETEAHLGEER